MKLVLMLAVLHAVIGQTVPPEIRLVPARLELHADTTGFASGTVQVLNPGGEPLEIRRITPSCKCAAATVLKNPVYPLEVGGIAIRVNTTAWQDTVGTVELDIETNASSAALRYVVVVHRRR